MPAGWVAAAGSLIGGIASASSAGSAASAQAGAAENAQAIQQQEFNTITQQEQPFMNAGYGGLSQLNYLLGIGTPGTQANQVGSPGAPGTAASSTGGSYGSLLTPFTADTMRQYSPAYQFQLQQGQQGVLNADAASQGALSGAALKDLTSYNQNYANTAFGNAFNQYQTQQGNIYSRLAGLAQLGQAAATNTGQQGTALAGQAGQAAQNIGTAQAGGIVGMGNAIGGTLSNLGGIYAAYGGGPNSYNNPWVGGGTTPISDTGSVVPD